VLNNIAGEEGIASPELVRDLRLLCSLEKEVLAAIAEAFLSLPDEPAEEPVDQLLLARVRSLKGDPEKLGSAMRVAGFLWLQWGRRRLTREKVLSDLRDLGLTQEQIANVSPVLDAMECKIGILQRHRAERSALGTGTAHIDSAICVVDLRAVFESPDYHNDLGDDQPYHSLYHFVPVVILEIISELNEDKTTQAYLLTEKTLGQLCDILLRAKKRLEIVKNRVPSAREGG